MTPTHTTNRGLEKYFGSGSPFAEASYKVHMQELPPEILAHSETLGDSKIAYRLGYAFAAALKQRSMRITRDDIQQIGWMKVTVGNAMQFEKGFEAFQAEDRA
jgi:hypothetical protein